jgi:hypothetical protein
LNRCSGATAASVNTTDGGNWLQLWQQQQLAISIAPEIRGLVVDLEYFAAQLELLYRWILVLLVR